MSIRVDAGPPFSNLGDRGENILYRSDDGATEIQLRAIERRIWLSQAQIAELFGNPR